MGNTMLVFRVYDQSGLLHFFKLYYSYVSTFALPMDKCSASATFVAKYFKDQNASTDEETEDHEDLELLECGDFDPFMASYRKCKKELTAQEKQKFLFQALCKIRENPIMVDIIRKMFDFD